MEFQKPYDLDSLTRFFQTSFLPDDFKQKSQDLSIEFKPKYVRKANYLGEVPSLNLKVVEIHHDSENDPRVGISKDIFRLMAHYGYKRALALLTSSKSTNYRISLVTIDLKMDGSKVTKEYSNPRRYSFYLGPKSKEHTPQEFLVKKGRVTNFDDLQSRFSIEVVNKEFYNKIALLFTELAGGERKIGSKTIKKRGVLKIPGTNEHIKKQEFAVRLIGRLVFCWFLKKKTSAEGSPLIPADVLSVESVGDGYYHDVLETLFFQVLNTPGLKRKSEFNKGPWKEIPFLNGGLFEAHDDDYYDADSFLGKSKYLNTLDVPDDWIRKLLEVFDTYNFTIDENTSADVELSVEPEMLGRIFENLLAEISPETGESARKSTGSFYTPRPIVEYMVDESLKQYLHTQTDVDLDRLAVLLSYSDDKPELTDPEQKKIISALDRVKILDPACGSGAFPMGCLQKIRLILQKVDPDTRAWLPIVLETEHDPSQRENLKGKLKNKQDLSDYTRKLGIIRKCIYGVDIQPIAVEISKLRFFLSLVVDEKIDDRKDNRGIEPLPNLEFKFVCANTLIGLPQDKQEHLFGETELIITLKELRDEYFRAIAGRKHEIEKKFTEIQRKLTDDAIKYKDARAIKLASWKPFLDQASDWFNPDWMFGVANGFNIVIGNPPYLEARSPLFTKVMKKSLQAAVVERWQGDAQNIKRGADLLVYFLESNLKLMASKGFMVFLTQNSWLDTDYGHAFQGFLLSKTNVVGVVDSDFKYFERGLGPNINTVITIFSESSIDYSVFARFHDSFDTIKTSVADLPTGVHQENVDFKTYSHSNLSEKGTKWGTLLSARDDIYFEMLQRLEERGQILNKRSPNGFFFGQGLNLTRDYLVSQALAHEMGIPKGTTTPIFSKNDKSRFNIDSTHYVLVAEPAHSGLRRKLASEGIKFFNYDAKRRSIPALIMPRGISNHFCAFNSVGCFSTSYVEVYSSRRKPKRSDILNLWLFLNSSFCWLYREVNGRKNLGGGMLKAEATDMKRLPAYFDFRNTSEIEKVFRSLSSRNAMDTLEELDSSEHRVIDTIVNKHLGFTVKKMDAIRGMLRNLIVDRLSKART